MSEDGINSLRNSLNNVLGYNLLESISNYDNSPNNCKQCGSILPYNKRKQVFCNIDCKRVYDRKNMSEYQKYYRQCQFRFSLNDFPNEFEFSLIEEHGWYKAKNHGNNLNGVSRDHIYSIRDGYNNKIDSNIIKHPANCLLMTQSKNSSKHSKSNITLDELKNKINDWNLKYK